MPDYRKMVEDLFLAPAKGYLAQSPRADFGGGLLGNFLTKAHQAIDPVNGLGGYGGLLAMALPPGRAAWHGSRVKGLTALDPDAYKMGSRGDSSALGVHFTTDPRTGKSAAGHYARGGQIYEAEIGGNLYPMTKEEYQSLGSQRAFRDFREKMSAEGYDGVILPEGVSHSGEVAVWNPKSMRVLP